MKYTALTLLFIFGMICHAQEPVAALQSPEINILYRGYPNIVTPAVTNNNGKRVVLSGSSNLRIVKRENSNSYNVYPEGNGRSATVSVLLVDGEDSVVVMTMPYRIQVLPSPTLYWSGSKNGGKANIRHPKLFVKYPPEIPLKAVFKITGWSLVHQGDTISGEGSRLTPAEEFFKTIKEKTTLEFEVKCIGPDGITRRIRGEWIVLPWEDEKNDEPEVFRCG